MTTPRSSQGHLPPILRRRLCIVAILVALATTFFSAFRYVQPGEWAYFRSSPWGVAFLLAEAAIGVVCIALSVAFWRAPAWWTLARLPSGSRSSPAHCSIDLCSPR